MSRVTKAERDNPSACHSSIDSREHRTRPNRAATVQPPAPPPLTLTPSAGAPYFGVVGVVGSNPAAPINKRPALDGLAFLLWGSWVLLGSFGGALTSSPT
jgi:hypothetical protein